MIFEDEMKPSEILESGIDNSKDKIRQTASSARRESEAEINEKLKTLPGVFESERVELKNEIEYTVLSFDREQIRDFLDTREEIAKNPEEISKIRKWAENETNIHRLRRGIGLDFKDIRDPRERCAKMAALFLKNIPDINGHSAFEVNFEGVELAEWNIGAGHLLPANVSSIKVYNKQGDVLFANAVRGIKNGRLGYFDADSGKYAYIHSGYKIEVLSTESMASEPVAQRIKEENEIFELNLGKTFASEILEKYFKQKGIDIEVDDGYFYGPLKEIVSAFPQDWLERYQKGEFKTEEWSRLLGRVFSAKDLNFLSNYALMLESGKSKKITLGNYAKLRRDKSFGKLAQKKMSKKEAAKFLNDLPEDKKREFIAVNPAERNAFYELLTDAFVSARKKFTGEFQGERCEQAVDAITREALKMLGIRRKENYNFQAPIDKAATAKLRGKHISELTEADLAYLKPMTAIYVANPAKYQRHGETITPGTSGKIRKISETDRHWVIFDGKGFMDNFGRKNFTLDALKRFLGKKDRAIVNVHDPIAGYRQQLYAKNGAIERGAA